MDHRCGRRVEASEDAVEMSWAALLGAVTELSAEWFVAWWRGEQAVEKGAQIQAGSTNDDGQASAFGDSGDRFAGEAAVLASGAGLVGSEDVDQVVRHAGALGERGFSGADLHSSIDSDRVAGDDFAGKPLGEFKG